MKKRHKDQLCVYRSEQPAVTEDHIFACGFFLESQRGNVPKVPACEPCNNNKSKLELYLTAVLPFGGRHEDAAQNLASLVPPRLRGNKRLHRELLNGSRGHAIPLAGEKLEDLIGLIARGLVWYHWHTYLNDELHSVAVKAVAGSGATFFKEVVFKFKAHNRVEQTVGRDIFKYQGVQGIDDPTLTGWHFSIYGGLVVGDAAGEQFASDFIVLSGPKTMFQRIDEENARIRESQGRGKKIKPMERIVI